MEESKFLVQANKEIDRMVIVLKMVRIIESNQPIGIIKLSEMSGLPRHRVRYILRLLELEGVLGPSKSGCVLTAGYKDFVDCQIEGLRRLGDRIGSLEKELSDESGA